MIAITLRRSIPALAATMFLLAAGAFGGTGQEQSFAMPGVRIVPIAMADAGSAIVPADIARKAAAAHWQWPANGQVTETLALFSDDDYAPVSNGIAVPVFQDRPAWVVTITGIDFRGLGRADSVNHEVNIVVDATTGQVLELFSYR